METSGRKKIPRLCFAAGWICLVCEVFGWRKEALKCLQACPNRGQFGLNRRSLTHTQKLLPHPRQSWWSRSRVLQ